MTSETYKVKAKVQALSSALSELEAQLEPLFDKLLPETLADLEPIQQAKLQTVIPYVVYDLIFMYLKTQGIDPKTHPVISELDRIKQYFEKIQNIENPPKRTTEVDKAAASRFIQHAISQAQLQKDQLHWKKTAAEDEDGESSDPDLGGKKQPPAASKTSTDPVAGPSSQVIPAKVTSKMLERQRHEQKMREDDAMNEGEDSDVLEIFEEDGEDAEGESKMEVDMKAEKTKQSQKSKGKGKAKQVEASVTYAETTTTSKRRRVPMDPFAGEILRSLRFNAADYNCS
ncbi:Sas10/Utp3/C1D family-domain-containing protein [Crepidotus variabilis]|uniref:Exosome complex protein n=1 Tax=Crepidotus variabilis TaxID=179855 RepID=A0A9P6JTK5_9AGAR|nr:Sas10/Utp3/C1D family-domain-containing protein [Crepidotus variabilis]